MHTIRSLSGFALALAIGYAAGVLMCVDAYHLGQSTAMKDGPTGSDMICLPRRQGPAGHMPIPAAGAAAPTIPVGGTEVCLTLPTEHIP